MHKLLGRGRRARGTTPPGVLLAYEFVIPSYQWVIQRLDAVDLRIQTLQAFSATVTLAAPILAATVVRNIDLQSLWFIGALIPFVAILVIGASARAWPWGGLILPSPQVLYDDWLEDSDLKFRKDAVKYAGKHFESNRFLINTKGYIADFMTALFVAETMLLLTWVLTEM